MHLENVVEKASSGTESVRIALQSVKHICLVWHQAIRLREPFDRDVVTLQLSFQQCVSLPQILQFLLSAGSSENRLHPFPLKRIAEENDHCCDNCDQDDRQLNHGGSAGHLENGFYETPQW